jgi:hypothetical protein
MLFSHTKTKSLRYQKRILFDSMTTGTTGSMTTEDLDSMTSQQLLDQSLTAVGPDVEGMHRKCTHGPSLARREMVSLPLNVSETLTLHIGELGQLGHWLGWVFLSLIFLQLAASFLCLA